jgi:hypothetical protein
MRVRGDNGRVVRAAVWAATLSGAPSTAYALATGRDPLEAALAAGAIVVGDDASRTRRLAAAVPVHLALSLGWTLVLDRLLPQRHRALTGALAGLAIAAVDLGVIGRRIPAIAALPLAPQVADHLLFGALGASLAARGPGRIGVVAAAAVITAAPCAARRRGGSPRR